MKCGVVLQKSSVMNLINKSGQSPFMFYAIKNSLQPLRTSPRSGFFFMLKSFNKNTIKKNKIKKKMTERAS